MSRNSILVYKGHVDATIVYTGRVNTDATLQTASLFRVCCVAMDAVLEKLDDLYERKLFGNVFAIVQDHATCDTVVSHVCGRLLSSLAAEPAQYKVPFSMGRVFMCQVIESSGTKMMEVVQEIMARHYDNTLILEHVCTLLVHAFNTKSVVAGDIVPSVAAIAKSMQRYVVDPLARKFVQVALCALDSITRGPHTKQMVSSIRAAGGLDVVEIVLASIARTPDEDHTIYEDIMRVGCLVVSRLAGGWRVREGDAAGSVDTDILHAMLNYPENYQLHHSACAGLAALAQLNLHKFKHKVTAIQYAANAFQVAVSDEECETACTEMLANFAFDQSTQRVVPVHQTAIGDTGVIAIAVASLKRYYDRNTSAMAHVDAMCGIVRMLSKVVDAHRHNKQRMLFANTHGLLLSILVMRRKQTLSTAIEAECICLLCKITVDVFEHNGRQLNIIQSACLERRVTSPNAKNRAGIPTSLIAAALCAIEKKGAPVSMIVDCLDMLGRCAQVPPLRAKIGTHGIDTVVKLMAPRLHAEVIRLGMIFLEEMSQEPCYSAHAALQTAVRAGANTALCDNAKHCQKRKRARSNIAKNLQDSEEQS